MKNKIDLFPPPPSNLDKRKFPRTAKSSHDSDQHGDVDDTKPDSPHSGPDQSVPYPVSRPAPAFDSVDLAAETAQADVVIGQRVSSQLQVIADQVKPLQARAKKILEQARQDARLHQARCAFRRLPGKVYHLYRRADGVLEFSMSTLQTGAARRHTTSWALIVWRAT